MYKVVLTEELNELEKQVNELMAQGWVPIGGVSVTHIPLTPVFSSNMRYSQALVKE